MFRTALASTSRRVAFSPALRAFHTSPVAAKTVTEKVKEVASDVNIRVGKTLASGIEKGEKAAEATKQTVSGSNIGEVADNVNQSAGRGVASAIEKSEQATEKAQQMMGTASNKTKQQASAASEKTKEQATVASQKTNQTAAGVREGMSDLKQDVEKQARK